MKKPIDPEKAKKKERRWRRFFKCSITLVSCLGILCLLASTAMAVFNLISGDGIGHGVLYGATIHNYKITFAEPQFTDKDQYTKTDVTYYAVSDLSFEKGKDMVVEQYPDTVSSGTTTYGTTYSFVGWSTLSWAYLPYATQKAYRNITLYAFYNISYFEVQARPETTSSVSSSEPTTSSSSSQGFWEGIASWWESLISQGGSQDE